MATEQSVVTLRDAVVQVGVSRKILAKWIQRLDIETARHPVDFRYRIISEEAVTRITATRDQMPWRRQQSSALARSVGKQRTYYERFTPTEPLPDGWLALSTWCAAHGLYGRSVWRAIAHGKLPAPQHGHWQHGIVRNMVLHAYTTEQHEKADALAATLWPQRFRRC